MNLDKQVKQLLEELKTTEKRTFELPTISCEVCQDYGYISRETVIEPEYTEYRCPEGCEASKRHDDLPDFGCMVCKDMGRVQKLDVPPYHPMYGKLVPCSQNCEAVQHIDTDRVNRFVDHMKSKHPGWGDGDWQYSAVPTKHNPIPATFDGYASIIKGMQARYATMKKGKDKDELGELIDHRLRLLDMANAFVDNQDVNNGQGGLANWVVLMGYPGTGKTLLASVIANELGQQMPVWFCKLQNAFMAIKSGYDNETDYSYEDMLSLYQTFPVLIIDEIRLEHMTGASKDIFYAIIDRRYAKDKPTVLTMNATPREFGEHWGSHILDRVGDKAAWFYVKGHLRRYPVIQE